MNSDINNFSDAHNKNQPNKQTIKVSAEAAKEVEWKTKRT